MAVGDSLRCGYCQIVNRNDSGYGRHPGLGAAATIEDALFFQEGDVGNNLVDGVAIGRERTMDP